MAKSLFDMLSTVEATSPKKAAEKYTKTEVVRHLGNRGGEIVVKSPEWPHKAYVYSRK